MKTIFSICCFVLVSMFGLYSFNSAYAQNRYERHVLRQLNTAKQLLERDLRVSLRVHEYFKGSLNEGESESHNIRLRGNAYVAVGACDEDCTDIDLYLYDRRSGRLIISDVEPDDRPYISMERRRGRYRLEVEMYACSTEPCYYGVMVLYSRY